MEGTEISAKSLEVLSKPHFNGAVPWRARRSHLPNLEDPINEPLQRGRALEGTEITKRVFQQTGWYCFNGAVPWRARR